MHFIFILFFVKNARKLFLDFWTFGNKNKYLRIEYFIYIVKWFSNIWIIEEWIFQYRWKFYLFVHYLFLEKYFLEEGFRKIFLTIVKLVI